MKRLLFVAAVVLVLSMPACFGQASAINGQIEGTVTDASGAVVPGVTVTIENVNTGFRRELQTDSSGFFRFTVLPLGTYNLKATFAGFRPETRSRIVVDAGTIATLNV